MRMRYFAACMLAATLVASPLAFGDKPRADGSIEPNAGNWRTWVISSGADYRVPPPPGSKDTKAELNRLSDLVSHNDAQDLHQIAFWDAGAPAYRWIDLINARVLAAVPTTTNVSRVYTYVGLAMYDATIAAWESKYFYNRKRPSELDHKLPTALPVPDSPSYPSEHAAAAQAAASVLAYFLPAEAQSFQSMAEEAGWSRVLAGLQFPSDYDAGLALGRKVALFPSRADFIRAVGKEGGDSRIWAGIHYPMDNAAGVQLGRSVAQVFISRAQSDGSQ